MSKVLVRLATLLEKAKSHRNHSMSAHEYCASCLTGDEMQAVVTLLPAVLAHAIDAERLADEVAVLVLRGWLDSRSPTADALLDFREPPSSPRSDRLAEVETRLRMMEGERDLWTRRQAREKLEASNRRAADPLRRGDHVVLEGVVVDITETLYGVRLPGHASLAFARDELTKLTS